MILKNTTIYSIGIIIPKAASFLLLPIYTRYLSPGDYGIVESMHVLSVILTVLSTLAIDRSIYRLYFEHKTEDAKKKYLGTITISLLIIAMVFVLLLFLGRSIVSMVFQSIPFSPYYSYTIITVFLTIVSIVPKTYYQVEQKAAKFILFSLGEFFSRTILIIYFIVFAGKGAEGMLLGQLVGASFLLPFYLFVISKIIIPRWDKNIFIESIKYSFPMVFGLLSAWILNLSDRIFIERYFSVSDVGIYSLAYKLAEILLILTVAINQAFSPLFFKIANNDENIEKSKQKLFFYNKIISIIIIFVAMIISLFSREFIMLLDEEYQSAFYLVPIIMVGIVFSQIGSLANRSFYQEKKTVQPMLIGLGTAILNVLLNFLLVPRYGNYGAAYSTTISFLFLFIVIFIYARKYYFIPIAWRELLPLFTLFIISSTFFYYFDFTLYVSIALKVSIIFLFIGLSMIRNNRSIINILTLSKTR